MSEWFRRRHDPFSASDLVCDCQPDMCFYPRESLAIVGGLKCMTEEVREGIIIEKVGNGPPFRRSALENAS